MKRLLSFVLIIVFLMGCMATTTQNVITKNEKYAEFYNEKPHKILIMPPINRSTNVDAKDYFYSTLNVPFSQSGYYVYPTFLTYHVLQSEGAYDSELFINGSLSKFREFINADAALFSIIHSWDKLNISAVKVDIEYFLKSTKTDKTLFHKRAKITVSTKVETGLSDVTDSFGINPLAGLLMELAADVVLSATNTALTENVYVARTCNNYSLQWLPLGKYHEDYLMDKEENAGPEVIDYYFR